MAPQQSKTSDFKSAPDIPEKHGRIRGLTAKQRRFVEEYLVDLNATQAAIRAGYSPRTASAIGCENLRKPQISTAVEKGMAERGTRVQIRAY
jgi:phage terminase small subunit